MKRNKADPRGPQGFMGKIIERNGKVFVFNRSGDVIVIYNIRSADRA